jgi:hypothetical protein
MTDSTPERLRFPPVSNLTLRADFEGGALSSDFGPLILQGVNRQTGLIEQLAGAIRDTRHPSYVDHPLPDLLAQRVYQVACGYEDGNDADHLRRDPLFKLGVGRRPLDEDNHLASAATLSRLENAVTARDIYRMAQVFIQQFVASYATPPTVIILDMDHSEDATHGQQAFSFFNHHYGHHCYLPLFVFEGLTGRFITAVLRPGKTPTGAENALIMKRVIKALRSVWPETHFILRGDGHFSNPELMQLCLEDGHSDFIFGVAGNQVLKRLATPHLKVARQVYERRCDHARFERQPLPPPTRTYHDLAYKAGTWPDAAFRVILKAEVMERGDNPRFVVTSLDLPNPESIYRDLYAARGQDENYIKVMKNDLASDRTSCSGFLANHLRLYLSCAAYVLHHSLKTEVLCRTELEKAQPLTVMLKLFKLAVKVVQYKDRVKLHLPSHYPFKALMRQVTERLFLVRPAPA